MAEKIVRKITKDGGKAWFHVFVESKEKAKDKVYISCTEKEYKALALKGAATPKHGNMIWTYSFEGATFDKNDFKKDDVQVLDDGSVQLFLEGDAYDPTKQKILSVEEYSPVVTNNGDGTATLTTSKEVPAAASLSPSAKELKK